MNSATLTSLCLIFFYLGYKFYSRYISYKIYDINNNLITPANSINDGVDFVPTDKHVLFGHHFTSIAGAAPIIGPCIAVYWGWLPALSWVVLGSIFMGAVHDFGALVLSLKEKGKSVADISASTINNRIRILFLIFIMCLTWLVLAVFANAISGLFSNPNYTGYWLSTIIPFSLESISDTLMILLFKVALLQIPSGLAPIYGTGGCAI